MRILGPLCVMSLVAACSSGAGKIYPISPEDAASRLHNLDDSGFIAERRCSVPISMTAESIDPMTIKWTITAEGAEAVIFSVKVEPAENGQSRVIVALPRDPSGGEVYDGNKHLERPIVQRPLRPAVEELAAAAIEGRKFDPARVAGGNADEVCVMQRQTSGSGHILTGGSSQPHRGTSVTLDAWGTPINPDPGNFGRPMNAGPAPVNAPPPAPLTPPIPTASPSGKLPPLSV